MTPPPPNVTLNPPLCPLPEIFNIFNQTVLVLLTSLLNCAAAGYERTITQQRSARCRTHLGDGTTQGTSGSPEFHHRLSPSAYTGDIEYSTIQCEFIGDKKQFQGNCGEHINSVLYLNFVLKSRKVKLYIIARVLNHTGSFRFCCYVCINLGKFIENKI